MKNCLLICSFIILSSCASKKPDAVMGELNIYQPSILVLEKGVEVKVRGGKYTPQTEEVWHSDKRFRELERKGY